MPAVFGETVKFNSNQNFSVVEIGSGAPILEVELNEMQMIQNHKRNLSMKSLVNDGFVAKGAMSLANGTLNIPPDTIVALGEFIEYQDLLKITGLVTNDNVYLHVFEAEKTGTSTLYRSGNLSSGTATITNQIIDSRVGEETSRRLQKQLQLVKSVPGTIPDGEAYLPIATITGATVFTDNRVKVNLLKGTDYVRQPGWGTCTNVNNAYSVTTSPALPALVDGVSVYCVIPATNTGASSLNWNSSGNIAIKDSRGNALVAGKLIVNTIVGFRYSASLGNFQLLGEGGDVPKLTNLIKNGSFSSTLPLNCWVKPYTNASGEVTSQYKFGDRSVQVVTSDGVTNPGEIHQPVLLQRNHVYYGSAWFKRGASLFGQEAQFDMYNDDYEFDFSWLNNDVLPLNTWTRLSGLITWISSDLTVKYRAYTRGNNPIYCDGFLLFDVTEIFGEGNEPSKEVLDNIVTRNGGWWDSSLTEMTFDATATAADIASGKIAYVNGERIIGTYVAP